MVNCRCKRRSIHQFQEGIVDSTQQHQSVANILDVIKDEWRDSPNSLFR